MTDAASPSPPPTAAPLQPDDGHVTWWRTGWAIAGFALLALLLAWQLFASFAFDPLVRWAAPRWIADRTGHELTIAQARLRPWQLIVGLQGVGLRASEGTPLFEAKDLEVDLDGPVSLRRFAWVLQALRLEQPTVHVRLREGGASNWGDFIAALAGPPEPVPPETKDAGPPQLWLQDVRVLDGRILLQDRWLGNGFEGAVDALDFEARNLTTLTGEAGEHRLTARTDLGATLQSSGRLALNPLLASGEIAVEGLQLERLWPYLKTWLSTAPVQGQASLSLAYQAAARADTPTLQVERGELRLSDVVLRLAKGREPSLAVKAVSLADARLDLAARTVDIGRLSLEGGRLDAKRAANGAVDLLRAFAPPPAGVAASAAPGRTPGSSSAPPVPPGGAWRVRVAQVNVQDVALGLRDRSFSEPLRAQVGALKLGFDAEAEIGAGAPSVRLNALGAELSGLRLSSGDASSGRRKAAAPWFELASISLEGGAFSLSDRLATVGRITAQGGKVQTTRNANGAIGLVAALQPAAGAAAPTRGASAPDAAAWRFKVDAVQLKDFAAELRDQSTRPANRFALAGVQVELGPLTQDFAAVVPVTARGRVASGGFFALRGNVRPSTGAVDLRVDVDKLALKPAAPYVAQQTALALADGHVTSRGRLRLDGSRWRYAGIASVQQLRIDERTSGEQLVGWEDLATRSLIVSPQGLRTGEVALEGLKGRLTIYEDRSVNLVKALKPAGDDGAATPSPTEARAPAAPAPVTDSGGAGAPPAFPVAVERLRFTRGEVDFADLSLALPFAARVRDLNGQIVGLGNGPSDVAEVELEGRVDEYGLARAAGNVKLADPTDSMDLRVTFRNVEMTSLTPYSATFAGRRIASGKLSLDLQYRIQRRQLQGDNQVLMDQLTLGERVESPDAMSLPLDLAIALLQDADGRIELGLPVSGSLDDPQFSYGQIIWKAIVNVLTKIVTAPFRALGALLGGAEQTLDRVGFDPGRAALTPPEREKLAGLAQGLAKRPALALAVQPTFNPQSDAAALREQALRRAVALQAGRVLAEGEEPGPIAISDAATRGALEKLFEERFGAAALTELRNAAKAAAGTASAPAGAAPGAAASAPGAPVLHERLLARLRESQPIADDALAALAARRGTAIRDELTTKGVAAERLSVEQPGATEAEGGAVESKLALQAGGPARQAPNSVHPAPAPASGIAPGPSAPASSAAPAASTPRPR